MISTAGCMPFDCDVWSSVQPYLKQKQACNAHLVDATGLAGMHACL